MKPVSIHWAITDDLPTLCRIDSESRAPWLESDFIFALKSRRTVPLVAEHNDATVGFLFYRLYPSHLLIDRFATHPDRRRQSVARQLLSLVARRTLLHHRARVICTVHEDDTAAHFALASAGFRCTAITRLPVHELAYTFSYTPSPAQWAEAGVKPPADCAENSFS